MIQVMVTGRVADHRTERKGVNRVLFLKIYDLGWCWEEGRLMFILGLEK